MHLAKDLVLKKATQMMKNTCITGLKGTPLKGILVEIFDVLRNELKHKLHSSSFSTWEQFIQ